MTSALDLRTKLVTSGTDFVTKVIGRFRPLPDFIIIGAQKAGTTSLHSYLSQHPEIVLPTRKELHYFDHSYQKGERWYRGQFPALNKNKNGTKSITGEATPNYLFHPFCPGRIRETIPDVKLIVVLRNPVDRAISHYSHVCRYGAEPLPMMEAFLQEDDRLAPEIEKMRSNPHYRSTVHQYYSYLSRGKYVEQLCRYTHVFNGEQLLVLKAEDLFTRPAIVLKDVCAFLGINSSFVADDLCPRNVGGYNRAEVPEEVVMYLDDYFSPFNKRLNEHLGRDFGW